MKQLRTIATAVTVAGAWFAMSASAQDANYDETRVPAYTLPELFGDTGSDPKAWRTRRSELLRLFEDHVYGQAPEVPSKITAQPLHPDASVLEGRAVLREVALRIGDDGPVLHLLVIRPATDSPSPVFLGLNFKGNHSVFADERIALSPSWMRNDPKSGYRDHRATAQSRGVAARRWPVELIVRRGYALATMYYGDIDPDFDDGFRNGVHRLETRREPRPANAGGSIAAWAWGLSRALDYLETDPHIDAEHAAVFGHSRLGKTALWAGATDERFGLVISNNSGCGGAALHRREFGETVRRINTSFPHWFCDAFTTYNQRVDALPVDQHQLIALVAPRACYVASAVEDRWADPKGEYLSLLHAAPAYRRLGQQTSPPEQHPAVDQPWSEGPLGYHVRSGKHDVTEFDWRQYLEFADRIWGR